MMVPQTTTPKARQPSAGTLRRRVDQNDILQPVDAAGGTQTARSYSTPQPPSRPTNAEPNPTKSAFAHFFLVPFTSKRSRNPFQNIVFHFSLSPGLTGKDHEKPHGSAPRCTVWLGAQCQFKICLIDNTAAEMRAGQKEGKAVEVGNAQRIRGCRLLIFLRDVIFL